MTRPLRNACAGDAALVTLAWSVTPAWAHCDRPGQRQRCEVTRGSVTTVTAVTESAQQIKCGNSGNSGNGVSAVSVISPSDIVAKCPDSTDGTDRGGGNSVRAVRAVRVFEYSWTRQKHGQHGQKLYCLLHCALSPSGLNQQRTDSTDSTDSTNILAIFCKPHCEHSNSVLTEDRQTDRQMRPDSLRRRVALLCIALL
jgi:hypothetical protein